MSATPPHWRLLTQSARDVLKPMGLVQKGRSRIWLDDHVWWLCVVEFQPSSWQKGSYLNVGAMWLWGHHDGIYFAVGHRVAPLAVFESESQFSPEARNLAEIAAKEVLKYRKLFRDCVSVAKYLDEREDGENPPADALDAGIAWGLAGESVKAARAFDRHDSLVAGYLKRWENEDWFLSDEEYYRQEADEDYARAERFRSLVRDPRAFRHAVWTRINEYRSGLKLGPVDLAS